MIKVDDALKTVLGLISTLPPEEARLTEALDRVLTQDVYADIDIPQLDNSAMDGYAVKSEDVINATASSPTILEVVEDIKAGDLSKKRLQKGEASRIMTGAPMPEGADSVVIVENTQRCTIDKVNPVRNTEAIIGENKISNGVNPVRDTADSTNKTIVSNGVKIFKGIKPGENVRRKGEDIKSGELIIAKGTPLTSAHIGILASLGIPNIRVTRKPKVAVLATGDEVVDVDEKLELGKLRSSNTYTLYSQILKSGGLPKNLGIAKDKPEELEEKLKQGLDCDMILTSGGVSVGDYDFVKFILAKMGTDIKFWQVAMRPGKPLVFGLIQGKPILGLPGNPASSMVAFEVFVRPALLKMLGQTIDTRKEVDAVLEEDIEKRKGLRYFLRAKTRWEDGVYLTRTSGPQGSGILKSMALANSLIILPEEEERIEKGRRVTVRFLD